MKIQLLLLSAATLLAQEAPLLPSANLRAKVAYASAEELVIAGVAGYEGFPRFQPPCLTAQPCPVVRNLAGPVLFAGRYSRTGDRQLGEISVALPGAQQVEQLIPLPSGGFFVAVSAKDGQHLFRINALLEVQWQKRISAPNATFAYQLRPEGDIVYSGTRSALQPEREAYFLGQISLAGEIKESPLQIGGTMIRLAPDGSVLLVGTTPGGASDLKATPDALQERPGLSFCGGGLLFVFPCNHQYVARVSPNLQTLHFLTWLSGESETLPSDAFVRHDGSIVLLGTTTSKRFPTTKDALIPAAPSQLRTLVPTYSREIPKNYAIFLSVLAGDGTKLLYATYLGGAGEARATGFAKSGDESLRLRGTTTSSFPGVFARTAACAPFDQRLITGENSTAAMFFELDFDLNRRQILGAKVAPAQPRLFGPVSEGLRVDQFQANEPPAGFAKQQNYTEYSWLGLTPNELPDPEPAIRCLQEPATVQVQGDTVAPGQIVAMYGEAWPFIGAATYDGKAKQLPTMLQGARVTIDGVPVPLLYVSQGQVNFAAPSTLEIGKQVQLALYAEDRLIAQRTIRIVDRRPAAFLRVADPCLTPAAVANFSDGTPVTCDNRAADGDLISFFVQGIGLNPARQSDGQINHEADIAAPAQFEVEQAELVSVTPALEQPAGIWQVTVRMRPGKDLVSRVQLRVNGFTLEQAVSTRVTIPQ